ncbi:putative receptor-like protein kinase At4g00960 [Triticum dicoccoides]|uniref:putative receptor-like protein kinase At4g00960 n=1 Tax=Triticum dicoccoides TaxID=85692 RepID=UPI00188F6865|nr:putative receptor-like protein kinase At4g00960 [Triticum dicoccoides]
MDQNILEQILEGRMKPTHLPLETLRKITNEFSTDRIIGEGGFGTVYKGVIGNRTVAVKRIMSSMTINQKLFLREVDSQMDVSHENVVRFLGLCSHTVETPVRNPDSRGYILAEIRERLLCFEYVSNGSLDKYIADELRGLEWDIRYQIIKGICAGLHYLHEEKRILHMDLKPANILLDDQMVPKITDFGLSRPVENPQTMTTNHFSSPGYGAPENLFGRGTMSVQSDMYSLGVIIVELVTGERKGIPDNKNNINPLYYWEDGMLGVEPLELQFEYNEQQQISSCSVELSNDTDGSIAFKIQSTSPLPYFIERNGDIVKPHSKCSVVIAMPVANTQDHKGTLQYGTSNKQCSQEFIVQSIKVDEGLTTKDINQDMFDKHTKGHQVDEILLTVVSAESCSEELPNTLATLQGGYQPEAIWMIDHIE